jgi:hypothetical protein
MYPRTNYEMTEEDLATILDACKSVPVMMIGSYSQSSPQENANRAWAALGNKMGFDHMTVEPIRGKGSRFFTAVPSETEEARKEREAREATEKRWSEIAKLNDEITERQKRIGDLTHDQKIADSK